MSSSARLPLARAVPVIGVQEPFCYNAWRFGQRGVVVAVSAATIGVVWDGEDVTHEESASFLRVDTSGLQGFSYALRWLHQNGHCVGWQHEWANHTARVYAGRGYNDSQVLEHSLLTGDEDVTQGDLDVLALALVEVSNALG